MLTGKTDRACKNMAAQRADAQTARKEYIEQVRVEYPEEHVAGLIALYVEASQKDDGTRNAQIVALAARREREGRPLTSRGDLVEVLSLATLDMMVSVGW